MTTYWVTKYALSGGIKKIEDGEVRDWSDGHKSLIDPIDRWRPSYLIGREAFDNEADAKADAQSRRDKKIASLKKQIGKLEKLTF
jgi:hypothetical protein